MAQRKRDSGRTQGMQAVQLAKDRVSGKGSERGIGLDQNYILPENQEKDMGRFFAIIFFLFLITGGFHYFLLSLQLMTNAKTRNFKILLPTLFSILIRHQLT